MPSYSIDGEIEQRYIIQRNIGSGAYGVVWCAVDRMTGKQVALKKVFDAFRNQEDAQRTFREVMLLSQLKDNHRIVPLLNVIRAVNGVDLYLVFELAETDLNVVLRKHILENIHRQYIAYQTVLVVGQLHARGILHRDIKPANVFVESNCSIKLGDFGLARTFSGNFLKDDEFLDLTGYIATRWYRSPEILMKSNSYSTAMDMWAVGCMIAELHNGQPLFCGTSMLNQLALIIAALGKPSESDVDSLLSEESWALMDALPAEIPHEPLRRRLSGVEADAVDLICKLIVFNPNKRLTAVEALQHPYIAAFVTADDWASIDSPQPVTLPLPDDKRFPAKEYRAKLYDRIAEEYQHKEFLC